MVRSGEDLHHFALKMRNVTLPFHSNLPISWAD
jgi:hypothetical protein